MDLNEVLAMHASAFEEQVGPVNERGCRLWTGFCDEDGYGQFQFRHDGKKFKVRAHRVAFLLAGNELPAGALLRHTCDTPACVEPSHLLLGTQLSNVADRVGRDRSAFGEQNGRARMTTSDVLTLRDEAASFIHAQARKYGVDESAIRAALAQKTWLRVRGPDDKVVVE